MTNKRVNLHATAIVLDRRGYLIMGRSGSGKSTLGMSLLNDAERAGRFAALISDDQVFIENRHGRLIACRPETIRGLIEIRYSGIVSLQSVSRAVIDAILLPVNANSERLPEDASSREVLAGLSLPVIHMDLIHSHPYAVMNVLMRAWKDKALGLSQAAHSG
ncbi:HPr kinase/phosphorylase [Allorhizobium sp. BGMRC 0089]|uniref:HPr kinase/phosphorylase n=1 Tax=Allorhizobium sonneratiae TaxID=2934936 RepID=UPI0020348C24|nr:HPr kinase/phosphorylase [Allorhizobium sonneratiae]MCM2294433.1 HPr kinase/phosphorylase [Allorhizobium sonneratiae]